MQKQFHKFTKHNATILVISFAQTSELEGFKSYLNLSFEMASDPSHAAYESYGLKRATFFSIWHPKVIVKYATLLLKGRELQSSSGTVDLAQLGGDFVIDGNGKVLYAFTSDRADLRPSAKELLNALER